MISVIRTLGAVLWRRGPELLAAYLVGAAAHFLLLRLAGLVTAASEFWGMFVHPLPILARLISYVVMILIVRDALPTLSKLSPTRAKTRAERNTALINAILMSILPFFAFYYASGFLNEDMRSIIRISVDIHTQWILSGPLTDDAPTPYESAALQINGLVLGIVVLAFGLRSLAKRYEKKLPSWTRLISVYLEVVWVFLTVSVIKQLITNAATWLEGRSGLTWLFGIGEWFTAYLPPVAAVWQALLTAIATAATLVGTPLAWLTIAGVVYGQTIETRPLEARVAALARAKNRYGRVNQTVREGIAFAVDKVAGDTKGRLATIGKALLMALRAGPVFLGVYVLLFQLWNLAYGWLDIGLLRLFGPLNPDTIALVSLFLTPLAAVIAEPIRSALVSAAYDTALSRTVDQATDPQAEPPAGTPVVPEPAGAAATEGTLPAAQSSATSTISPPGPPSATASES